MFRDQTAFLGDRTSASPADDAESTRGRAVVIGAARGGGLNIAGALCSQLALFAITTIVARGLGQRGLGGYALAFAILSVLNLVALVGFQSSLTRFVAMYRADSDPARLRGVIRLGLSISVGCAVVLSGLLALLAGPIADLFHSTLHPSDLRMIALALPAFTLRDASLAATQGWRTQRAFAVVSLIIEPILRLGLTGAIVALGYGVTTALGALVIGSWLAAGLGCRSLNAQLRSVQRVVPIHDTRRVLAFTCVAWATGLCSIGLIWADTLLLGALTRASSVGEYNVATRLVNLAVFVMVPVNAAFAPQFAHLLHVQDNRILHQAYAAATTWVTRLSLPAFVVLLVFPRDLLRLFGSGFVTGANVTVILALGQFVNALTGPCGTLLNMSGRNRLNLANNTAVLLANVGLNLWLIPMYGITGAAIAWAVSLASVNLARLVEVHVMLRQLPFGRGTVKAIAAAGCAAVGAVVVHVAIEQSLPRLLVGGTAVAVIYVAVVLLLRLSADDWALLGGIAGGKRVADE